VTAALSVRGVECVTVDTSARDFAAATEHLEEIARTAGPVDGVVVTFTGSESAPGGAAEWKQVLDAHAGLPGAIRGDAAWVRAAADHAAAHERPVRVVTVTDATTAGGWSRGQAAAQLARSAHGATADRVDAFAISVESAAGSAVATVAEVAAHLLCASDTASMSGAELVVDADWFGLRSHPGPVGTLAYHGPAVPGWVDSALRGLVTGRLR
jgi:hypothetical protein